jgi:hypothetical protein
MLDGGAFWNIHFFRRIKKKNWCDTKRKKVSKETREKLRNAILGKKRGQYKKKQE